MGKGFAVFRSAKAGATALVDDVEEMEVAPLWMSIHSAAGQQHSYDGARYRVALANPSEAWFRVAMKQMKTVVADYKVFVKNIADIAVKDGFLSKEEIDGLYDETMKSAAAMLVTDIMRREFSEDTFEDRIGDLYECFVTEKQSGNNVAADLIIDALVTLLTPDSIA